jgi:uncharacterized membrane protein YphA (DoxX/SURF4 family)
MNIALWIIQVLLGLQNIFVGFLHGYQIEKARARFSWPSRYSVGMLRFIGTSEILGGLGLILPMATGILPWLTPLAAIGIAIIQILALFMVHLPRKEYKAIPVNGTLLVLALIVAIGRWELFTI